MTKNTKGAIVKLNKFSKQQHLSIYML